MFSWLWRWHRECLSLKKKKKQNPLCVVICSEIVLLCRAVKHFSLLLCLFVYTLFFLFQIAYKAKGEEIIHKYSLPADLPQFIQAKVNAYNISEVCAGARLLTEG